MEKEENIKEIMQVASTTKEHEVKKDMSWGKGFWMCIHLTGADATSPEKAQFYCDWLRMIISKLPCGDCRNHAAEYITLNPPELAEDAFIHSWRFHNTVNRRLKKPEMDYSTAAQMYIGDGIKTCNSGCGQ